MEKDTRYNKRKQASQGKRNQRTNKRQYNNDDDPLVIEYHDTLRYFDKNPVPIPASKSITIDTASISDGQIPDNVQIEVLNMDSFELAIQYVNRGLNPLVLNMASDYTAGGGVHKGARAQEEDLFRRSSYRLVVDDALYPLRPDQIVYSPEVYICKDIQYNYLAEPVRVACLAVPGLRHPSVVVNRGEESYMKESDYQAMCNKIAAIFTTAIAHGHDALVLGALGCGVFANPVHAVAGIFRDCVATYGDKFKCIGFAILGNNNRGINNLITFQETFDIE